MFLYAELDRCKQMIRASQSSAIILQGMLSNARLQCFIIIIIAIRRNAVCAQLLPRPVSAGRHTGDCDARHRRNGDRGVMEQLLPQNAVQPVEQLLLDPVKGVLQPLQLLCGRLCTARRCVGASL